MSSKFRILLLVGLLLLFVTLVAAAQEAPPDVDPNANACGAGGVMEGKCNQDTNGDGIVEAYEVEWAWGCGWYLVRLNANLITMDEFPVACGSLIPPPPPEPTPVKPIAR
jgi:hypothetical protein